MANPTKFTFDRPTQYSDGTVLAEADLQAFRVTVDGAPSFDAPIVKQSDGRFSVPIPAGLAFGSHSVFVRTVTKNGAVSAPSATATFTLVDERVPNPPTSLRAE